ncbi:hypothetical protein D822_04456 [Streptococcus ratti FA-1 = DSM 20564]|nr:hypothetical protein D822_04456 [Streptococcus ratti FA-1 = DSM 20564]
MKITIRLGDADADRTVFMKSRQQGLSLLFEEYEIFRPYFAYKIASLLSMKQLSFIIAPAFIKIYNFKIIDTAF